MNINEYHSLVHQPITLDFQYGSRTPLSLTIRSVPFQDDWHYT